MKVNFLESFNDIRDKNMLTLKEAKENGQKVVGFYCTYGPQELAIAAGAIPVGLCGTREEPIAAAEADLPRNLCPLIKSSYGFGKTDKCPYFHFSDIVIGETTCDGKKKMFELMRKFKKVHVMNLPQHQHQPASLEMMYEEMVRLKKVLEAELDTEITDEAIGAAINVVNRERKALKALFDLNQNKPALFSGSDLLKVSFQISFHSDREERISLLNTLINETKEKAKEGYCVGDSSTPRILLTGTPVGLGCEKVINLVEESGGLVVTMENCGSYKTLDLSVAEDSSQDKLMLLAQRYLKIPCSVMTPNTDRLTLLEKMIDDFKIDGVIDLTWQACHTYNIESYFVADLVKSKANLPFLHLETDYSNSDLETLRLRINAFLEMM
ncbi:MAG: double-cubane-cluster-containing anaerobic reductase [Desulfitobacteriaceae bacterium]|nr:double-cubane-cluster-containing anaerobic reductase [Desulfitobacteriaceae bacterium]MDD4753131.1 double-cubane-cluster-containing anaerobic reductase [Desulfitobacteriaceae bacterium]